MIICNFFNIYICACVCERRCILLCLCAVWPVGQPRVNAGSRFPGCAAQPPLGSILRLQWVVPCFLANQFQFQRLDNQKIQDASSLWCFWCFSPMYATSIYCIPRLEVRLWAMVSLQVHGNTRTSGQIGKTRQLSERAKGVGYFKAASTGLGHLGQEPLKHMCQVPHERSKNGTWPERTLPIYFTRLWSCLAKTWWLFLSWLHHLTSFLALCSASAPPAVALNCQFGCPPWKGKGPKLRYSLSSSFADQLPWCFRLFEYCVPIWGLAKIPADWQESVLWICKLVKPYSARIA